MSALYQTVTDTIISALERGVVPWRKPWSTTATLPVNAMTQRPYRGVNVLLLSLSPFSDHRWLTFHQVQEQGGRVRAGEKSTLIVFWKRRDEPDDSDQQQEPQPRKPPLLVYHRVFNADQCDGLNLPEVYKPEENEHQRIGRAELLVSGMPDPPRIMEGTSAWYRPADDLVQVPPLRRFKSVESYYATLFHELAHATGHERRLNRAAVTGEIQFGSGAYSQEELVAELGSAFCCATVGIDNSVIEDAASYIGGWLSLLKADAKVLIYAAAQSQRAADHIRGVTYVS